jgi:hypothetical protein
MVFDSERAILKGPDQFKRFNVTNDGVPLSEYNQNVGGRTASTVTITHPPIQLGDENGEN